MNAVVLASAGVVAPLLTAFLNITQATKYAVWAVWEAMLGAGCLFTGDTWFVSVVCFAPAAYYAVQAARNRRPYPADQTEPIRARRRTGRP